MQTICYADHVTVAVDNVNDFQILNLNSVRLVKRLPLKYPYQKQRY